jgi:hypothetical protein
MRVLPDRAVRFLESLYQRPEKTDFRLNGFRQTIQYSGIEIVWPPPKHEEKLLNVIEDMGESAHLLTRAMSR